jgi:hypothetical protein
MSKMSKTAPALQDKKGDEVPSDAPDGIVNNRDYKTSPNDAVPVVADDIPVDDPYKAETADSDKQLGKSSSSGSASWVAMAADYELLQSAMTRKQSMRATSLTSARAARRRSPAPTLSPRIRRWVLRRTSEGDGMWRATADTLFE